jgi:hypothetical protein
MKKKYTYNVPSEFTEDQIKKINGKLLAYKYECSPEYVKQVLKGQRQAKTDTAKGIIADAKAILDIAESQPTEKEC